MIELAAYGPPALAALEARIAAAKATDPLGPVTVVVPTNYCGLATRRALARRMPLVNVRFQVAARFAELLAGPALTEAGRRPLTPWIRQRAISAALEALPGVFAPVSGHPVTARELGRVFRELRPVSPGARRRVASAGKRAADVIALHETFERLTAGHFDEADILDEAARALAGGSAAGNEAGLVILYLPRTVPAALARLFEAAAGATGACAILGVTGDSAADAPVLQAARTLGAETTTPPALDEPPIELVVSATDPEEEVREAIRQAMTLVRSGVPLHAIAFTFADGGTYAGLAADVLESAGIPHNGPPPGTLADTLPGRTLLGYFRLASGGAGDPGYARDAVMDWLTSAPIQSNGHEAPGHRWDEISRDARVVHGSAQWAIRLASYVANQEARAAELGPPDNASPLRNAAWARDLKGFVASLEASLGRDARVPAATHAKHAREALDQFLPRKNLRETEQVEAWDRVDGLLKEVESLEGKLPAELDSPMGRAAFALALEELLSTPFGRTAKLGEGIFVGPIRSVGEMSFEAVFVLGMVEGVFPPASPDDPLLTSAERGLAGGEVPPAGEAAHESSRAYRAALLASRRRFLSTTRSDMRAQRAAHPSRWLLDAASRIAGGARIYTSKLEELFHEPPPWFRVVNSFESALRESTEPASLQEWNLGSLLRSGPRLRDHFLLSQNGGEGPLARGAAARRSRASRRRGALDEWRGKVPAGLVPAPGAASPVSPTSLQEFAKCPFSYFLKHVLHVSEQEQPEEIVTVDATTVGSIVHRILELFFRDVASRPDPLAPWTPEEHELLDRHAAASFDEAERGGLTGKDLTWRAERARIRRDLELLLDRELAQRREERFRFRHAELAFGMRATPKQPDPLPAATLELPDGRTIAFRGLIDRVDEGPDGQVLVTDYKTGSPNSFKELNPKNPLGAGRFLQLPVYALAFQGQSAEPVRARYWFISEAASFEYKEVSLDEATRHEFATVVGTFVDTMGGGYFPAVPGKDDWAGEPTTANCKYCAFDAICPSTGRSEMWEAVRDDPGLVAFASLPGGGND